MYFLLLLPVTQRKPSWLGEGGRSELENVIRTCSCAVWATKKPVVCVTFTNNETSLLHESRTLPSSEAHLCVTLQTATELFNS